MNIMKTNMLSLDNKIKKEGTVNAAEQAPVALKAQSNAGMKALMFQGMQNLMANPMLAKQTGVMNDEPKTEETDSAKSYVAPYSSNIAFQGTASKTMKVAAIGALMALAASLTSCTKEYIKNEATNIVDMTPVVNAIYALGDRMDANDAKQYKALQDAIAVLIQMQAAIQNQTLTIESFRYMVEGHMQNGEFQRSAILEAIMTLQNINEEAARAIVNSILVAFENSQINFEQAMAQILEKLQKTNDGIDDANKNLNDIKEQLAQLNATLNELNTKFNVDISEFKQAFGDLYKLLGKMYVDGKNRTQVAQIINMKMSALLADVEKIKQTAIDMRNKIKQSGSIDYDRLETMFKLLNMNQQEAISASTEAILAKLDAFIAGQENIEKAIKKLDQNNGARTKYIAYLIKNKTNDNADVIEAINNLAASNEENIAAATEALAARLDALNAKADVALGKMDGIAKLLQQYGDKIYNKLDVDNAAILDAIKENGKKLDLNNMTLAELKAEVEKIKPELVKLNTSADEANAYLDIIAKRQLEIKQEIENLEAIAGGGLTKDELEELWKAHDANAFAKAKAYLDAIHADDIAKADEIIEYLKKGNKTAADTYDLLLKFANKADLKADDLKKLLQAVYDYLPELICKCNCQGDCDHNQQTHEGIIGILD